MRKLVKVEDIYTRNFVVGEDIPITECPFVKFAKEIHDNKDIKAEDTMYYKWLKDLLEKHGEVWRSLRTDQDLVGRVEKFRGLITSLEGGYKEELEEPVYFFDGKKYGGTTAVIENGKVYLIDGTHRTSIQIALGVKEINLDIYEVEGVCE